MDSRAFVEMRVRRYMAQTLDEFEAKLESQLPEELHQSAKEVKATIRKKMQTLGSDCLAMMPSDVEINGYEPVRRS
jgi:phosphoribosylaminoimidazole (AIR) synthetase